MALLLYITFHFDDEMLETKQKHIAITNC